MSSSKNPAQTAPFAFRPDPSSLVAQCAEALDGSHEPSLKLAWKSSTIWSGKTSDVFRCVTTSPDEIEYLQQAASGRSKPSKACCPKPRSILSLPAVLSDGTRAILQRLIEQYRLTPQGVLLKELRNEGFNADTVAKLTCRLRSCGVIVMVPGTDGLLGYLSIVRAGGRGIPFPIMAQRPPGESKELWQLKAVLSHWHDLFGIANANEVRALFQSGAVKFKGSTTGYLRSGQAMQVLVASQGKETILIRLLDGTFIGFSGNFLPELFERMRTPSSSNGRQAVEVATAHLGTKIKPGSPPLEANLELNRAWRRLVWRVSGLSKPLDGDHLPVDVLLDADTFAVLTTQIQASAMLSPNPFQDPGRTTVHDVRHYQPSDQAAEAQDEQISSTLMHDYEGGEEHPNAGVFTAMWYGAQGAGVPRTPIHVYERLQKWQGRANYWHTVRPDPENRHFVARPGEPSFPAQHAFYWTYRAYGLIDHLMYFYHPAPPQDVWPGVTIVEHGSELGSGGSFTGIGCKNTLLLRVPQHGQSSSLVDPDPRVPPARSATRQEWASVPCIHLGDGSRYGPGYSAYRAKNINVLFHEIGHAIDLRYGTSGSRVGTWEEGTRCIPNTSDEGKPLNEAIAGMMSMALSELIFGDLRWMDYQADGFRIGSTVAIANWPRLHAARGPGTVHRHASAAENFTCTAPAAIGAEAADIYRYGAPMLQAYWQILKRTWCPAPDDCETFGAELRSWDAVNALFHGMRTISEGWSTFRAFAHAMIESLWLEFLLGGNVSPTGLLFAIFIFQNHSLM